MKSLTGALFVLVLAALALTAAAQTGPAGLHWALRLNETRGPIRTVNLSQPLGKEASDRKSTRLNSSHSRASRMPSSA